MAFDPGGGRQRARLSTARRSWRARRGSTPIAEVVRDRSRADPGQPLHVRAARSSCGGVHRRRARRPGGRTAWSSSRAPTRSRRRTSAWDLVLPRGAKPVVVTGAMRASARGRVRRPGQPARRGRGRGRRPRPADSGVVVVLAGTIEAADDVQKTHTTALDTFASPNGGSPRPGRSTGTSRLAAGRAAHAGTCRDDRAAPSASTSSPRRRHGRRRSSTPPSRPVRTGSSSRPPARATRRPGCSRPPTRAMDAGHPGRARLALPGRRRRRRPMRSPAAARPGSGPGAIPAGHLCALKARVALALGLGAGLDAGRSRRPSSPTRYPEPPCPSTPWSPAASRRSRATPASAGSRPIGIRDGRVAFAGSEVDLETRADPFTRRIRLEPDEVAIPGLTDAHLHLAQAAMAARQVDLTDAATLADGLDRSGAAARGAAGRTPGWRATAGTATAGAAGRRPTTSSAVAPGRRARIWAHDHHALWASHAALARGRVRGRRPGRAASSAATADGRPEGVLFETATRLVTDPRPATDRGRPRRRDRGDRPRARWRSASSPATTRAAWRPTPT